jgi:hypothetical protein
MTSIDVELGSQIGLILLQLGFQFETEAEISPWTAIALSRIQVPNTDYPNVKINKVFFGHCGNRTMFTANCHVRDKAVSEKCDSLDLWQFMVKTRPRTMAARILVMQASMNNLQLRTAICHDDNPNWNASVGKICQIWDSMDALLYGS